MERCQAAEKVVRWPPAVRSSCGIARPCCPTAPWATVISKEWRYDGDVGAGSGLASAPATARPRAQRRGRAGGTTTLRCACAGVLLGRDGGGGAPQGPPRRRGGTRAASPNDNQDLGNAWHATPAGRRGRRCVPCIVSRGTYLGEGGLAADLP